MKSQFIEALAKAEATKQHQALSFVVNKVAHAASDEAVTIDRYMITGKAQFAGDMIEKARKGHKLSEKQIEAALNSLERGWAGLHFSYSVNGEKIGFKVA